MFTIPALLRSLSHPELRLDSEIHQVEIVSHGGIVLAPVAEIFRWSTTIILHLLQALRKPTGLHLHILQCLGRATADTSCIQIRNIHQFASITDNGKVILLIEAGGLRIEPHRTVATGGHAERVTLTAAEYSPIVTSHATIDTGTWDIA